MREQFESLVEQSNLPHLLDWLSENQAEKLDAIDINTRITGFNTLFAKLSPQLTFNQADYDTILYFIRLARTLDLINIPTQSALPSLTETAHRILMTDSILLYGNGNDLWYIIGEIWGLLSEDNFLALFNALPEMLTEHLLAYSKRSFILGFITSEKKTAEVLAWLEQHPKYYASFLRQLLITTGKKASDKLEDDDSYSSHDDDDDDTDYNKRIEQERQAMAYEERLTRFYNAHKDKFVACFVTAWDQWRVTTPLAKLQELAELNPSFASPSLLAEPEIISTIVQRLEEQWDDTPDQTERWEFLFFIAMNADCLLPTHSDEQTPYLPLKQKMLEALCTSDLYKQFFYDRYELASLSYEDPNSPANKVIRFLSPSPDNIKEILERYLGSEAYKQRPAPRINLDPKRASLNIPFSFKQTVLAHGLYSPHFLKAVFLKELFLLPERSSSCWLYIKNCLTAQGPNASNIEEEMSLLDVDSKILSEDMSLIPEEKQIETIYFLLPYLNIGKLFWEWRAPRKAIPDFFITALEKFKTDHPEARFTGINGHQPLDDRLLPILQDTPNLWYRNDIQQHIKKGLLTTRYQHLPEMPQADGRLKHIDFTTFFTPTGATPKNRLILIYQAYFIENQQNQQALTSGLVNHRENDKTHRLNALLNIVNTALNQLPTTRAIETATQFTTFFRKRDTTFTQTVKSHLAPNVTITKEEANGFLWYLRQRSQFPTLAFTFEESNLAEQVLNHWHATCPQAVVNAGASGSRDALFAHHPDEANRVVAQGSHAPANTPRQ